MYEISQVFFPNLTIHITASERKRNIIRFYPETISVFVDEANTQTFFLA